MIKKINTKDAPAAIGPYSQAVVCGDILFSSGQIPINPETGKIQGTEIEEQAKQVMMNIEAILKEAGIGFSSVIKTTCYLKNMDDFAAFNSVYEEYFVSKPARSCVEVAKLPLDVLCEIEIMAKV